MEVLKNLGLVIHGDLIPLPNMIKVVNLIGLEAVLITETKKKQNSFMRLLGNNSLIGVPSLQQNNPTFVKSLDPVVGLNFCFLVVHSRAGSPGGKASGLTFKAAILLVGATTFTTCRSLGFALRGVNVRTESGKEPSMIWFSMLLKNLAINLKILETSVIMSFAPLLPCLTNIIH
jgi:hypothetical protein